MKKTTVHIPKNPLLDYSSKTLFLGSCFAENLSEKMKEGGFKVSVNPFGVIFNPISLADLFLSTEEELIASVFTREDVSLSWSANSTCFAYSNEELKDQLLQKRKQTLDAIQSLDVLFITFGTALVYEHKKTKKIVANCHKAEKNNFTKRLLTIEEIEQVWNKVITVLEQSNTKSNFKIIFTLSPIRHIKDGLVENSRSKALLLTAIHHLVDRFENVDYFPAFEMVNDEMRDYAYYTEDGVHPNQLAINMIWKRFINTFFTKTCEIIHQEFESLKQLCNHRSIHAASSASKDFELKKQEKIKLFEEKFPFLKGNFKE